MAAFAAAGGEIPEEDEEDNDDDDAKMDKRFRVEMADSGPGTDPEGYDG